MPVRDDHLLLPDAAWVRSQHPGLRDQSRARLQWCVDRDRHRGRVLDWGLGVLAGTKGVAGLASGGLIIGTLIPGAVLVILGVVFLGQGNPSAAPMTASNLLPAWAGLASLVLIVNNFLSYSGMEMNAVHVSSLRDPGKEFPKTIFLASGWCC